MALINYFTEQFQPTAQAPSAPPSQPARASGISMAQESLQAMLSPGSNYIENARRRGAEQAAVRGGVNSSIAAGASERAAIEAAQPFVTQAMQIEKEKQDYASQNWLAEQGFNREFQGQLAMMPVQNSFNMLNALQQFSMQDPELYTPDVVSGYSNFFTQNMGDIINRYFGGK